MPQGSVLGRALFSVLAGDLSKHNNDNVFVQYADDLNIICPFTDITPNTVRKKIMNQLKDVLLWCSRNKQELNMDKSKFLLCTRQPVCFDEPPPIQSVSTLKVLGITLNDKLTWDDHVQESCKKACQRLHVLRKVKPYLDRNELHAVYCAIIRTLFDFCCPVYIHLAKTLCKRLQQFERRAHRLMYGSYENYQCTCDMDGFVQRREEMGLRLFLRILQNKHHLLHDRTPDILPHSKRYSNYTCRTEKRLKSFFPYVTMLHNKYQSHVK